MQSASKFFLNNELLSHFIKTELETAEIAALRQNGRAGFEALAASDRYATAVALIDAIDDKNALASSTLQNDAELRFLTAEADPASLVGNC